MIHVNALSQWDRVELVSVMENLPPSGENTRRGSAAGQQKLCMHGKAATSDLTSGPTSIQNKYMYVHMKRKHVTFLSFPTWRETKFLIFWSYSLTAGCKQCRTGWASPALQNKIKPKHCEGPLVVVFINIHPLQHPLHFHQRRKEEEEEKNVRVWKCQWLVHSQFDLANK